MLILKLNTSLEKNYCYFKYSKWIEASQYYNVHMNLTFLFNVQKITLNIFIVFLLLVTIKQVI